MPKVSPTLFIVAGPNGAGKSTTSKEILSRYGIKAFDWDAEFYNLWKKFSYDPSVEQGVSDKVVDLFTTKFNTALKRKNIFAYETNFHSENDILRIKEAKKAGYKICIIFFYMPTVKKCIARVKERVSLGGHDIPDAVVKERFYAGIKNLNKHLDDFDALLIYNTSLNFKLSLIIGLEFGKVIHLDSEFLKTDNQLLKLNKLKAKLK